MIAPKFIYGTAWKEEATAELTLMALEAGFTAIDTANQRKHYYEEAVGLALEKFLKSGSRARSDLFIQTKFTFARGQDHRKPYDEAESFTNQVKQSFESSLQHLKVSEIDSYLLHGPFGAEGLSDSDWETWSAMESLFNQGRTKALGVSNFNLTQLEQLHSKSTIKPAFVQNRCFAALNWDKQIRDFCQKNKIHYQGFSVLTANARQLSRPEVRELSNKYKATIPQLVFQFCRQIGIIPLTGTSSRSHMLEDLTQLDFVLTSDELEFLNYRLAE